MCRTLTIEVELVRAQCASKRIYKRGFKIIGCLKKIKNKKLEDSTKNKKCLIEFELVMEKSSEYAVLMEHKICE